MKKVKLPFTEEFLWDLYSSIETITNVHKTITQRSLSEVFCPDRVYMRRIYERRRRRKDFTEFLYRLKRAGYLREERTKNKKGLLITKKGMKKILRISEKFELAERELIRRKDGKWQMVMYDIPEDRRVLRNRFRKALGSLGYRKLQKSIWVSPYDVFERTEQLIYDYNVSRFVRLFLIEEIRL